VSSGPGRRPRGQSGTCAALPADRDREPSCSSSANLLRIFLAEISDVRPNDVEQLADDGGHAAEMARPARAFEQVLQAANGNRGSEARWVDRGGRGMEHQIGMLALAKPNVGIERPRIALEVLVGPELEGIDEDRDDDAAGPRPALAGSGWRDPHAARPSSARAPRSRERGGGGGGGRATAARVSAMVSTISIFTVSLPPAQGEHHL